MAEPEKESLQWNLRERMRQAGITSIAELHRRLGEDRVLVSQVQLGRFVRHVPARINTRVLQSVCRVLKCEPGDLLSWNNPEASAQGLDVVTSLPSKRQTLSAEDIQRLVGPRFHLHGKG